MGKNIQKAFTLIELIVIMAIMGIFSTMLFIDYGKNSKIFTLERAAQKAAQDIRRAQEMAMGGSSVVDGANAYGVYFDKTGVNNLKYIIYGNKNVNWYYDSANPADVISETINIEKGIKICDIKNVLNGSPVDSVSVSFKPPDPTTYIDSYYTGYEASIILCIDGDVTKTRTVKVNNSGRIDVTNPNP